MHGKGELGGFEIGIGQVSFRPGNALDRYLESEIARAAHGFKLVEPEEPAVINFVKLAMNALTLSRLMQQHRRKPTSGNHEREPLYSLKCPEADRFRKTPIVQRKSSLQCPAGKDEMRHFVESIRDDGLFCRVLESDLQREAAQPSLVISCNQFACFLFIE